MITKVRESAALVLALGIALLLPPLALIFAKIFSLWGVPLPVLYVFGVWSALIVGIGLISRRLPPGSSE